MNTSIRAVDPVTGSPVFDLLLTGRKTFALFQNQTPALFIRRYRDMGRKIHSTDLKFFNLLILLQIHYPGKTKFLIINKHAEGKIITQIAQLPNPCPSIFTPLSSAGSDTGSFS